VFYIFKILLFEDTTYFFSLQFYNSQNSLIIFIGIYVYLICMFLNLNFVGVYIIRLLFIGINIIWYNRIKALVACICNF